jgi:transcriptional/translational regulatory protein YebC/TACO1
MGGSMAEPGSVAWQFSRQGLVLADRSAAEDDVMLAALDAGADDVTDDGDVWRITTPPAAVDDVHQALEAAGISVQSAEATMLASTSVPLATAEEAKRVLRIIEAFEDNDDVQDVYSNFDIPDDVLSTIDA